MTTLKPGDYGYRRKRNLNLTNHEDDNIGLSINWANRRTRESYNPSAPAYEEPIEEDDYDPAEEEEIEMEEEMEEEDELEEEDENQEDQQDDHIKIGNKVINLQRLKVKENQKEMEKMTIYLDKNLITILKILKKDRRINSYSQCIKDALEQYMIK